MARWSVTYNDFSMRPVHPLAAQNPVTRTLNMVRQGDGAWKRRGGFASATAPGSAVLNHLSCELSDRAMLIAKLGDGSVRYWTGSGSWQVLNAFVDANDKPLNNATWSTSQRGSLCLHGGEVYICDSVNIAVYDGAIGNAIRRPGVRSMDGILYYKEGAKPSFNLAFAEGVGNATAIDLQPNGPGISPLTAEGTIPGITPFNGEKALNCSFAFSIYDPKRHIYGRRSDACALPYVFGPPNPGSTDLVLTDERVQYSKEVLTPGSPTWVPAGHRVAVWFSLGMDIITNRANVIFSGWFFYFDQATPAMSPRMTSVLYLETIADPGVLLSCVKDNAALMRSGMYDDAYSRPVPSLQMAVLANGVAVYFFPRTREDDWTSPIGNYVEFSIRHPEQIARDTENNRDSRSVMPNLRGGIVATVTMGDRTLMLTRQTCYQIGFDGRGATLSDATDGRGVAAEDSITASTAGVLWFSDDGVVLMRGGSLAMLDAKLGFQRWFRELDTAQRKQVAIGVAEHVGQILVGAADLDGSPASQRFMVYDYENNAVSEFSPNIASNIRRMAMFRKPGESVLACFSATGGAMWTYPVGTTDSGGNFQSSCEMWCNEQTSRQKDLRDVILDVGTRNGQLTVTVDAYEHPSSVEPFSAARSVTAIVDAGGPARIHLPQFNGLRGRMFKVTVAATTAAGQATSWSLNRVQLDGEMDEDGHAGST